MSANAKPQGSTFGILKVEPLNLKSDAGFTMIEVLVVMGLVAIVGSLALFLSMDSYRASSFRADRDLLITLLQHARAQAIHNVCASPSCTDGKPHGVHIQSDAYVLFEGSSYAPEDAMNAPFQHSPLTSVSGPDIVFSALSGNPVATGTITLTAARHTSVITVNPFGRICADDPSC